MLKSLLTAVVLGSSAALAADLFPFVLPWDDATPSITDLSGLNDKPAGRDGFVVVKDGHLFAGTKRLRIFGVNVCFGANFPDKEAAPKIAAHMAKLGVNCVRFHHMDTRNAPAGIFARDGVNFDAERLDRLDFFIAQLKAQGIYADLNLHVARSYPDRPKGEKEGNPNYDKGVDNFAAQMIELQKAYARALLTHVNAYTGKSYAQEPAVALIEINNENALLHEWHSGGLDQIAAPYREELSERWTSFVTSRNGSDDRIRTLFSEGAREAGPELLTNGNFAEGGSGWWADQLEGTTCTADFANRMAQLSVSGAAKESWHAQLNHGGLKVDAGKVYSIRFRAKVDAPESIHVVLAQAHAPWRVFDSREVKLLPGWNEYSADVRAAESEAQARLSISSLARKTPTSFAFADVSLREAGIEGGLERGANGKFPVFTRATFIRRTSVAREEWMRFLWSLEEHYWPDMKRFVQQDLGARALIVGTQLGWSPFPLQQSMDVIDSHAYWQHPRFPGRPWDMENWTMENTPMAGVATGGTLPDLALQRVTGKPYICTEYNHAAPNTYSAEAFPLVCAYAALQDWDGVFAFAYSHRTDDWDKRYISSFFDIDQHPAKLAALPGAIALFRRGDVQGAREASIANVGLNEAILQTGETGPRLGAELFGVKRPEALIRRVGVRLTDGETFDAQPMPAGPVYTSDTSELSWDTAQRVVTVDTARSKAVIGEGKGRTFQLGEVAITIDSDWACVQANVIDGADFKTARRILVSAAASAENTDMHWRDAAKTSVGTEWGKAPSLVEGVRAGLRFPAGRQWKAWVLEERGQHGREVPMKDGELQIGPEQRTLWYEVTAE